MCLYRPRERKWSAKQNTERERERDLEEEEKEVGSVGLWSRAEERERIYCFVTVCCFASVYTQHNTAFCQFMMAVCFARGLVAWSCRYFFFLKLIEKCVYFLMMILWKYLYILYDTCHVKVDSKNHGDKLNFFFNKLGGWYRIFCGKFYVYKIFITNHMW